MAFRAAGAHRAYKRLSARAYATGFTGRLRKIHDIVLEGVELAPRKRKGRW
jgi:hypothetical protein